MFVYSLILSLSFTLNHYFKGKLYLLVLILPLLIIVGLLYICNGMQLLIYLYQKQWYCCWLFMALIVYYLVLPGPVVMPRYHLPALPFMCIMAALFVARVHAVYLALKADVESNRELDFEK